MHRWNLVFLDIAKCQAKFNLLLYFSYRLQTLTSSGGPFQISWRAARGWTILGLVYQMKWKVKLRSILRKLLNRKKRCTG